MKHIHHESVSQLVPVVSWRRSRDVAVAEEELEAGTAPLFDGFLDEGGGSLIDYRWRENKVDGGAIFAYLL